tara:strand:- start:617 stop:1162 length:546 start_codon:yes stop_codon:yes gene_type:complete
MLDENTAQMSEQVQDEQTTVSDDNVDYKQLYLDEVQNAKKLRRRAQDSELKNQDFLKQQETAKIKSLKSQEKYKELADTLQQQLNDVNPYKEKWESFEQSRRDSLLAKLPEADRERMSTKGLDTLEYIVSKIDEVKPPNPTANPGTSRNIDNKNLDKWMTMDSSDRHKNWDNIVDHYKKKQ